MITTIELAKVKLNPTDTPKSSIIITNDEGVLIVDKGLFSLSFDSEKVYITIVDSDGEAYDKSIKEEAWIYKNDEDVLFIYFQSAPFTRDVRYASEHYKFD